MASSTDFGTVSLLPLHAQGPVFRGPSSQGSVAGSAGVTPPAAEPPSHIQRAQYQFFCHACQAFSAGLLTIPPQSFPQSANSLPPSCRSPTIGPWPSPWANPRPFRRPSRVPLACGKISRAARPACRAGPRRARDLAIHRSRPADGTYLDARPAIEPCHTLPAGRA